MKSDCQSLRWISGVCSGREWKSSLPLERWPASRELQSWASKMIAEHFVYGQEGTATKTVTRVLNFWYDFLGTRGNPPGDDRLIDSYLQQWVTYGAFDEFLPQLRGILSSSSKGDWKLIDFWNSWEEGSLDRTYSTWIVVYLTPILFCSKNTGDKKASNGIGDLL